MPSARESVTGGWPIGHEPGPAESSRIPWLDVLTPEQRSWARGEIRAATFRANVPIVSQGGASPGWVGVLDGLVRIATCDASGNATTIAGFLSGSWFGEGTVLKREPCRYFADTLRVSSLALLPADSFHVLLEQSVAFNRFVLNQINERLSTFIAAREWERLKEPHLRVARQLYQLCGSVAGASDAVVLKVRQHELAELAGLSRQSVNAALSVLAGRGIVRVQYGGILILDVPALSRK